MQRTSALYRAVASVAVPLVPAILRDERQREAHRARLESPATIEQWARAHRDPSRPLAWFHAPSVGEGLQAWAVVAAFRSLRSDLQIVYTNYSPSAVTLAQTIGADWSGYLCYDRAGDVDRMLTAAAPELLV
ncbi:MAG: glycosyltransferase N-terminal domain-containing protein, partial [Gemmatimonadales bacterium]